MKFLRSWLLLTCLVLAATPVWARSTVVVGERVIMVFHGDKKHSADTRAQTVQEQIDALLQKALPAAKIVAVSSRGMWAVQWAGHAVCTVDEVQARANHCSAKELAMRWAKNLRTAVGEGFLTVSPASLTIPLGDSRRLTVKGAARGDIGTGCATNSLEVTTVGGILTVKGTTPGEYRLTVVREGATVEVPVSVKEYAGVIPDRVHFSVCGNPAEAVLLQEAAVQAARGAVQAKPGAEVTLTGMQQVPPTLGQGSEAVVKLNLAIEGKDYFPVSKMLEVVLRNEAVTFADSTLLMVSNRPEKIEGEGVLFRGSFKRAQPTRLLYSHINGTDKIQYLWVSVINRSDKPARLLVSQADGGPAREELYVGHRCNTRFLEDLSRQQGLVVTIPPRKAWQIGQYRMPAKELVSGLAHLQLLEGDELEVTVETSPQGVRLGQVGNLLETPFNPFLIHPKGTFTSPHVIVEEKFVVGGGNDVAEIPFGRAPWLIDPTSGEPNTGNYGVLYEMNLKLSNPTGEARKVTLFFEPISGVALGSFLVEGKLMETNCLKPPARGRISTVELAPQQTRSIQILTLPQAGSHYPARILIQSIPQQETHRESGGT